MFEPYESPELDERRPGARPRPRAPRDADRPRRRLPQLRQGVVRRARPASRRASSTTCSAPAIATCSSSRTRRPRRPGLAFLLATIAALGEPLAGLLARAARERRPRRRRLGGGVLRALLGLGREQGEPADRRLVRVEPAGRGDLPRPAADGGADRRRRATAASGRSSSPACCAARGTRTGARELIDFMLSRALPGGHPAADVRLPGARRTRRCRRSSSSSQSCPRARSSCRPRRSRRTASAGWTSGRTS